MYPGYVLIHPAWYIADWWIGDDDSYSCSSQQRESVLPYMLSVYQYEFIEDYERVAESGTVSRILAVMCDVWVLSCVVYTFGTECAVTLHSLNIL